MPRPYLFAMSNSIKVAVAGLGAVGMPVSRWLDQGVPGLELVAISAGDMARAKERVADFKTPPPVLPLPELAEVADVIVEALPPSKYLEIAAPVVAAGKTLVAVTVSQLIDNMDLVERARETGGRIIVPTGALAAFDAVRAAAKGTINSIVMATRKPPSSFANAPFVKEMGLDLDTLTEPVCLYQGSVRGVAQSFPANVNVAVALSLAGIGPDKTQYEIWADPGVTRNTHSVVLDSEETHLEFSIAGRQSAENPATGALTPLAVMTTLEGMVTPLRIGS